MHAFDIGTMTTQHFLLLATHKVPYTQRAVITACGEFIICWTETVQRGKEILGYFKWLCLELDID